VEKKNSKFLMQVFENTSELEVIRVLKSIGKLPNGFSPFPFTNLLKRFDNETIRFHAIKNLGKTNNPEVSKFLKDQYESEKNTNIRREIVSSIGRLRLISNIPWMQTVLKDEDPKVVMQAIRALLIFKKRDDVRNSLIPFLSHRNEIIREVVSAELTQEDSSIQQKKIDRIEKISPMIRDTAVLGDAREVLKLLPAECIQLTFTSPPYFNARDYSLYPSYEDYLDFLVEVIKEIHRVTEEGRFFILNTSPVLIPRFSRKYSSHRYAIPFDIHPRIIDLGFEFIDDIIWMKPAPSAKNRNAGFFQHRKPLGYKTNSITEYIIVYRKQTHKLIDWNMKRYPSEIIEKSKVLENDYEKTNVWKISPASTKDHPAIFPDELVYRILRFYSFIGDIILDPFAGSGTVGKISQQIDRYCFLVEINKNYFNNICSQFNGEITGASGDILKFFDYDEFKQVIEEEM
ncbi:MAG: DNA methyltransferase, partial [Candidatus Hodarchaeota archaeon]